ncbi:MAG TPA: hypothetical protein VMV81_14255, partial [Phycisphaerae bacterium]|nr:hypothetical protein [Phycisphaerae bacterium]
MFASRNSRQSVKAFESWNDRFCLVVGEDGTLHVRSLAATLEAAELCVLLDCLTLAGVSEGLTEIVFDLSGVSMLGPNSTLIWAMILNFARHAHRPCRLAGLRAQPAAAAS